MKLNFLMKIRIFLYFFSLFLSLFFLQNCEEKMAEKNIQSPKNHQLHSPLISQIVSMDTLSIIEKSATVIRLTKELSQLNDIEKDPYYNYFKGHQFKLKRRQDSAALYFEKMQVNDNESLQQLKNISLFYNELETEGVANADFMKRLFTKINEAEKKKTIFTYRFYDIAAQAYFMNRNTTKSLEFSEIYFNKNPFKNNPKTKQRFYEISFLLAADMRSFEKMDDYLQLSQNLAFQINDSLAIARSYDMQARMFALKNQPELALKSSKKSFYYMEKFNSLSGTVFNNLAMSFLQNKVSDSAIYYYKKGLEWSRKQPSKSDATMFYEGLAKAYTSKGDYKNALIAKDSAQIFAARNRAKIDAEKTMEIQTKYQTERKDFEISALKTANILSEKIIKQQRWIFAGIAFLFFGTLLYLYNIYRQKLLIEKTKSLQAENKKLQLEQKALQLQLNPHFIYNSIANLQGLISQGENSKSMSYLSSFSKLLRNTLELNRQDFITLEDEISSLNNYLILQKMRFENRFDYEINLDDDCDAKEIMVPPMLLQPFVENSIEHGFKQILYKGIIKISFKKENGKLLIEIDDNGNGFQLNEIKSDKKSLSKLIIQERLDVLFNQNKQDSDLEIVTKKDNEEKGFLVKIRIPLITE